MSFDLSDRRCRSCGAAALVAAAITVCAQADSVSVLYDAPSLDRWMYPFNPEPGVRAESSVFGTTGDPRFDDRDGQGIVGFDTTADFVAGLGADRYAVLSARLTIEISQDLTFIYDDSPDSYTGFLDVEDDEYVPDEDPGQPLELFGLGFRFGVDAHTFAENIPYTFGDPIGQGIRVGFAADLDGSGVPFDVSLNVEDRFDAVPWAVGTIAGLTPGAAVPIGSDMVFDINLANPAADRYFRESLDIGILHLCVTSLTIVEEMGTEFPAFHMRESTLVQLGLASAARLELEVELLCPADVDGGGSVNFADVLAVIGAWGPCEGCPEDIDGDGEAGFGDVLAILRDWGDCP